MIGKLKTLEEVKKDRKTKDSISGICVFHSKVDLNIDIHEKKFNKFGNTIEVELWQDFGDRKIYYDGESKDKYGQLYYDEWFEYVGEKIEHIPYELWSIEDL